MTRRYSGNDNVNNEAIAAQENVGRGDVPAWLLLQAKVVAAYIFFAGIAGLSSYLFHIDFYNVLASLALFLAITNIVKHP